MVADPLIFGRIIPQVAEYYETPVTFVTILYSVLYGGIVEEILLRLFFMSLLALIIKKIFLRKKENYPQTVFIISNIIAALLFAAGHLPATYQLFGEITPLILFRCFLLNGTGGLIFALFSVKRYRRIDFRISLQKARHSIRNDGTRTMSFYFKNNFNSYSLNAQTDGHCHRLFFCYTINFKTTN